MGLEDAPGSNLPRGSRRALLLAKVGSPHLTDSAPYWGRPDKQWSAPLSADNTITNVGNPSTYGPPTALAGQDESFSHSYD